MSVTFRGWTSCIEYEQRRDSLLVHLTPKSLCPINHTDLSYYEISQLIKFWHVASSRLSTSAEKLVFSFREQQLERQGRALLHFLISALDGDVPLHISIAGSPRRRLLRAQGHCRAGCCVTVAWESMRDPLLGLIVWSFLLNVGKAGDHGPQSAPGRAVLTAWSSLSIGLNSSTSPAEGTWAHTYPQYSPPPPHTHLWSFCTWGELSGLLGAWHCGRGSGDLSVKTGYRSVLPLLSHFLILLFTWGFAWGDCVLSGKNPYHSSSLMCWQ